MQAVILAGGFGTRLAEETNVRPKPMIEIGGKPLLWHIMKIYSAHGINDFVICLGYMGYYIKEYFSNYFLHTSDVTIDLKNNSMEVHHNTSEPWKISLIDTGANSMTGGRIKRIERYINEENFLLTYGDGVSDVNIRATIDFHLSHGKAATMTTVQPPGRFGIIDLNENNKVNSFKEKPAEGDGWINGGFFVLNRSIFKYIDSDETFWEKEPLERLAADHELMAYQHDGYWQPVDTLREKILLEKLWLENEAPWKQWE
jgi:glucose-1-phosphate cytidylyltransferase